MTTVAGVVNPWLIVHEPKGDGVTQTIVCGPEETTDHVPFAIILADCVRVLAIAFNVPEDELLALVRKELAEPTQEPPAMVYLDEALAKQGKPH